MDMKKYYDDIFNELIKDEELLRLLYYKPVKRSDSPLDGRKPDIKSLPIDDFWAIIDDRIVSAPKFDDIEKTPDEPKCRLLFYLGYGKTGNNHLFSRQEIIFDIFVHFDFENMDRRLSLICDRLHKILSFKSLTGVGKMNPISRKPIPAPNKYMGYSLVYQITTENY